MSIIASASINTKSIAADRIAAQYGYNSASVAAANQFSMDMWQRSADFNAEQAEIQRQWQERMDNTKYQRAIKDMEAAGLNPVLAVTGGGISTGSGSGSAASISPIQGQSASGGLLQGVSASEGNYTGQMEYMGGLLGLLAAGINGMSSAFKSFGTLGDFGAEFGSALANAFTYNPEKNVIGQASKYLNDAYKDLTNKHGGSNGNFSQKHGGSHGPLPKTHTNQYKLQKYIGNKE